MIIIVLIFMSIKMLILIIALQDWWLCYWCLQLFLLKGDYMRKQIMCAVGAVLLALAPMQVAANGTSKHRIAFQGVPDKKFENFGKFTTMLDVGRHKAVEYMVTVVKKGNRYYWKSWGNKELMLTRQGPYDIYIAIDGSGYIKVDTDRVGSSAYANSHVYIEHRSRLLGAITYFGK